MNKLNNISELFSFILSQLSIDQISFSDTVYVMAVNGELVFETDYAKAIINDSSLISAIRSISLPDDLLESGWSVFDLLNILRGYFPDIQYGFENEIKLAKCWVDLKIDYIKSIKGDIGIVSLLPREESITFIVEGIDAPIHNLSREWKLSRKTGTKLMELLDEAPMPVEYYDGLFSSLLRINKLRTLIS